MKSSGLLSENRISLRVTVIVGGAFDPALHFNEPQAAGLGNPALDVVPQLLELPVGWLEAQAALDLHDYGAGSRRDRLRVGGGFASWS